MGRIKTAQIKSAALELFDRHKDIFINDFNENKRTVGACIDVPSKKIRNAVTGYITRLVKKTKKEISGAI